MNAVSAAADELVGYQPFSTDSAPVATAAFDTLTRTTAAPRGARVPCQPPG